MNNLKLDEFLLGMILFSLPLSFGINSAFVIILFLFYFYKTLRNGSFINLKLYYVSLFYFVAQFCSYLLSANKTEANAKLLLYVTFLVFPICFSYLNSKKIKVDINKIFKFLFYGTTIILIYGSSRFIYDITFLNERYDYGRAVSLILKYIPHHSYMSIFILLSIYSVFIGNIKNNINKKSVFVLPFLFLFLILLGSRMAIFLGIFFLPFFIFIKVKEKSNPKKILVIVFLMLLVLTTIGFNNDYVRDKVIYTYYDVLNIATKEKPFFGVSFRISIWNTVIDLIFSSPILGYGIGDIQEILNSNFKDKNIMGLNAHNQYFQLALHHGVLITLSLVLLVIKLIKDCMNNKLTFLFFSWIILLFFCFTESILERQWGVVLFAFILNYSIYNINQIKSIDNNCEY